MRYQITISEVVEETVLTDKKWSVVDEVDGDKKYDELIGNIIEVKRKLGTDYLNVILTRSSHIENDVIIAVSNVVKDKENLF